MTEQKTNNILRALKIVVVVIFLSMLLIRVYVNISFERRFQDHQIFWPLSFIFVAIYKSKFSWSLGIFLFLYGLRYYFFELPISSSLKDYDFTQPLSDFLYLDELGYHTGYTFQRYIPAFPFLFYVIGLTFFLTNPIRKRYWKRDF